MENEIKMKHKHMHMHIISAIVVIVIVAALFFTLGGVGDRDIYVTSSGDLPTISVTGIGEDNVMPDKALVRLTVLTEGLSPENVQDENTLTMNQVMDALKDLGLKDKDIETTNYYLYPKQEYNPVTRKYVDSGYQLTHTITVTTLDLDLIGEILQTGVTNGINQVGDIQFTLSDELEAEIKEDLMQLAGSDAKEKARLIASGLGVSVGEVVKVTHSSYSPIIAYARSDMAMEEMAYGASAPSINPEEQNINIRIDVEFGIA